MPEWLKLIGIAVIVIGLALRLRTTIVVVTAGLVTGVLAGLPLFSNEGIFQGIPYLTVPDPEDVIKTLNLALTPLSLPAGYRREGIINMLGRAFTEYRLMTLFIITLPAIGLAERHGLQEQSARVIRRINAATVGRLQIVYQLFRVITGFLGLRLNGHPSFIRPLIFPMSLGAAESMAGARSADDLPANEVEEIKAANSAAENYGNFYGQNLSPVQAGILLVFTVLGGMGYVVSVWSLVIYTLPIVFFSIVLGITQFLLLDRRYLRKAKTD